MKKLTQILKEIKLREPVPVYEILNSLDPVFLVFFFEYDYTMSEEQFIEEHGGDLNPLEISQLRSLFSVKSMFRVEVFLKDKSELFTNLGGYSNMHYIGDDPDTSIAILY